MNTARKQIGKYGIAPNPPDKKQLARKTARHEDPDIIDRRATQKPDKKTRVAAVQQTSLLQDILYLLIKIVVILVILVLLFTFLFGLHRASGISMYPAVKDGDMVIFYRLDKNYIASDVLMLEYESETQIRRVVAVAGDTVDITEDGLMINGSLVEENTSGEILLYESGISFPLTIGPDQVFVLGDNRKDSVDSRMYGAVDIRDTLGKIITVIRQRNL